MFQPGTAIAASSGDRYNYKGLLVPYKAGHVSRPEDMGYVDIPKTDPACDFAFTGQMNGCHLVITNSSVSDHFRVWHYQSPGQSPAFTNWNFPHRPVYFWLNDRRYAGNVGNDEVAAFNFLWFHEEIWYVVSQPQKATMATTREQQERWDWSTYIAELSTRQIFKTPLIFG